MNIDAAVAAAAEEGQARLRLSFRKGAEGSKMAAL